MGPPVVFLLGLTAGVICHRRFGFWVACAVAGLLASVAWMGGAYLLFALTSPGELGPPLLQPILLIVGTAFGGAASAGAIRAITPARHRHHPGHAGP